MSKETIGPRIKRFRKKRKLTQEELANALGYSGKSVISHIESGDADMTYEKIRLLLQIYGLDANELFALKASGKKKAAVYIHGLNGSSKEASDYAFLGDDYDVIGLDYQDGEPWELKDPIRNEFEKITSGYEEVVVIANSIGAFYAYEYLSDYPIKQAFFISPVAQMHQVVFKTILNRMPEKRAVRYDDSLKVSFAYYLHMLNHKDHWKVPTDILYGEDDELIDLDSIGAFLATHPGSRLTIKSGSKHFFHTKKEKEFIKNWILGSLE